MNNSIYEQQVTIIEDSAAVFDHRLNEEIYRLRNYNPRVVRSESNPLYAYVKYSISESVPETLSEACEVEGVKFKCEQCPYFKPMLKEDETIDKRCKYGDCEFAEMGRTPKNAPACDLLYELIKDFNVKLVFNEED